MSTVRSAVMRSRWFRRQIRRSPRRPSLPATAWPTCEGTMNFSNESGPGTHGNNFCSSIRPVPMRCWRANKWPNCRLRKSWSARSACGIGRFFAAADVFGRGRFPIPGRDRPSGRRDLKAGCAAGPRRNHAPAAESVETGRMPDRLYRGQLECGLAARA